VHVLCLPAHTSHILQPLDVSIFPPMKASYASACTKYKRENPTINFTKTTMASIIGTIWRDVMTQSNIKAGFRKTGIHPYKPDQIPPRTYKPSILFQYDPNNNNNNTHQSNNNISLNINVNMVQPAPKHRKVKLNTSQSTFLTNDDVIQQIQQYEDQKQQKEKEVHMVE
jgi:DDE superfamily endonuclease